MKLVFHRQTFEKPQIVNFVKIHLVGVELFLVDRQTDRSDEANSRFPQFCESVKKEKENPCGLRWVRASSHFLQEEEHSIK